MTLGGNIRMDDKDFDQIMGEITSGLTGDNDTDIAYIKDTMEKYKAHKYSKEILRACGRLIFTMMPEDAKEKINQLTNNHILSVSSVIEEAHFNIYKKNFDKAKELLESMVTKFEDVNFYQDDSVSEYHTFNSLLEEILYENIHETKKEIRRATEPYSILYLTLGSVLFELGELENAKVALEKAIHWNPIDPNITFEYAEVFKIQGDLDGFLKSTMSAHQHCYQKNHLARFYRNLGYYFIEKKLWKMAAGCYMFSLHYENDHKNAQSELWYIQQQAGEDFEIPTQSELLIDFGEYNIPFGANRDVVGILVALGKQGKEHGNFDFARHYLQIAYELTDFDEILKMIEELPPIDNSNIENTSMDEKNLK